MLMLDSCSTETVSIENYEIQISKSVFMHIQVYLCKVSFLTILNIYKDYFKGRQRWCKVMQLDAKWCNSMQIDCECKLIVHANYDWRQNLP